MSAQASGIWLLAAVLVVVGFLIGRLTAPTAPVDEHAGTAMGGALEGGPPDEMPDTPAGPWLHPTEQPRPETPAATPPKPQDERPRPTPAPIEITGRGKDALVHVDGGVLEVAQSGARYWLVKQGRWVTRHERGVKGIPAGYWVYVYPNWYIWGDSKRGPRR